MGILTGLFAAVLTAANVPRPAEELSFKLADGSENLLSQYKGKIIAVEFLLTTCAHCQKCSQVLNKMYKEYGPKGFQPVGLAINEMAQMFIPDYRRNFGLDFPVGYVHRDTAVQYLQHPAMLTIMVPQLVFIDRKFTVRNHYPGGDKFFTEEEKNMREVIEGLLKEPPHGAPKKQAPPPRTKTP